MKALSFICAFALFTFVLNDCPASTSLEDCIKGTSGDNHCCLTTSSTSSNTTVSVCLLYDKEKYANIQKLIDEGRKTDKSFNIECEAKSSSSSSSYLKIGIMSLLVILF